MIRNNYVFLLIFIFFVFYSCTTEQPKPAGSYSFKDYTIEDGFELEMIASEPLIEAPVAMDFDLQGRPWVVEMRGYMPNLSGTGEDVPNGRISILENTGSNTAATSRIFLDSLVLPRALAHVYGGLLYAEPPNLWFVQIINDRPGKKVLVDSLYATGGYVEMQPNGLLMNIDNWIYSANSNFRYQQKDGKWIKERTAYRGQWGITKDNIGRLYYNYNELQLAGDYVLPNTLISNPHLQPKKGINQALTEDQRVYPLHATTVNRGYKPGILNKDSSLAQFTAACGPLVYNARYFPDDYYQNAFVCEPQANLVKRNILHFDTLQTTAVQAWQNKEFLASTDEGFRPVNITAGPDGALYVVDMHRGVMEHRAVSTPYYRKEISNKKLDTLLYKGRIIRIINKNKPPEKIPDLLHASPGQLVNNLKSTNGWIRDRSQQLLIHQQQKSIVPQLQSLAHNARQPVAAIHAMHTLNGLNALTFNVVKQVALTAEANVAAHALLLCGQFSSKENVSEMKDLAEKLPERKKSVIDFYLLSALRSWISLAPEDFMPVTYRISQLHRDDLLFQETTISSLPGMEEKFNSFLLSTATYKDTSAPINKLLQQTLQNKRNNKINPIFVEEAPPTETRVAGHYLYKTTCAACHGVDGDGIDHVGPPLKNSEYVHGSPDRLAMIILNGLEGPLHVNGQLYTFPGSMPDFRNNLSEAQIADIIAYLHNSYVPNARPVNAKRIRQLKQKPTGTLTEAHLIEMEKEMK